MYQKQGFFVSVLIRNHCREALQFRSLFQQELSNVIFCFDEIIDILDKGNALDVIYLDFYKVLCMAGVSQIWPTGWIQLMDTYHPATVLSVHLGLARCMLHTLASAPGMSCTQYRGWSWFVQHAVHGASLCVAPMLVHRCMCGGFGMQGWSNAEATCSGSCIPAQHDM